MIPAGRVVAGADQLLGHCGRGDCAATAEYLTHNTVAGDHAAGISSTAAPCLTPAHHLRQATALGAALSLLDVPPSVQHSTTSSLAGRGGDRLGVEE